MAFVIILHKLGLFNLLKSENLPTSPFTYAFYHATGLDFVYYSAAFVLAHFSLYSLWVFLWERGIFDRFWAQNQKLLALPIVWILIGSVYSGLLATAINMLVFEALMAAAFFPLVGATCAILVTVPVVKLL